METFGPTNLDFYEESVLESARAMNRYLWGALIDLETLERAGQLSKEDEEVFSYIGKVITRGIEFRQNVDNLGILEARTTRLIDPMMNSIDKTHSDLCQYYSFYTDKEWNENNRLGR